MAAGRLCDAWNKRVRGEGCQARVNNNVLTCSRLAAADQYPRAEKLISLVMSKPKRISRGLAKNKLLLKIIKSVLCFARSGPDEGRTRRHETLGRQCDGRGCVGALRR